MCRGMKHREVRIRSGVGVEEDSGHDRPPDEGIGRRGSDASDHAPGLGRAGGRRPRCEQARNAEAITAFSGEHLLRTGTFQDARDCR